MDGIEDHVNSKGVCQSWLICRDRKEWRTWLMVNHDIASEVWLQIRKAASREPGINLNEAVEEAICFGWIDGKMHSLDSDRFLLRMTPRKPGSIWSMINRKRAEALIAEERMTEAGMAPVREARANGRWQAAYSANEKPSIPHDLVAALQADPVAEVNFENWSNSQKLQAVYWLELSKLPETRVNRIKRIVDSAKKNILD
jgi:uncharacterized protein YdeI (YjbR/CyaY-like superfamily)